MEVWMPVIEFEGLYEVSNEGRVRRCGVDCTGRRRYVGHILKASPVRGGYLKVGLSRDRKLYNRIVSCLVMRAFVGPTPEGQQVNHKNGDKTNNRLENLEYLTAAQNYRHALDVLHHQPVCGQVHWAAILTTAQIGEIRQRAASGERQCDIARSFGVYPAHVSRIVNRKTRALEP